MLDSRGEEIDEWLEKYQNGNSFYMFDDVCDFSEAQREHVLMCSGNYLHEGSVLGYGLTNQIVDQIIESDLSAGKSVFKIERP